MAHFCARAFSSGARAPLKGFGVGRRTAPARASQGNVGNAVGCFADLGEVAGVAAAMVEAVGVEAAEAAEVSPGRSDKAHFTLFANRFNGRGARNRGGGNVESRTQPYGDCFIWRGCNRRLPNTGSAVGDRVSAGGGVAGQDKP